jgi:hypothetical protein
MPISNKEIKHMKKITEIHIFDFDGTLVDSSHRYRTDKTGEKIDLQYWIDNENKANLDSPIDYACSIYRDIRDSLTKYAVIATARIWCSQAVNVVIDNDLVPNSLVSRRGRNDNRGGAELKISHVDRLLNLRQFAKVQAIHVYEDNLTYLKTMTEYYKLKGYNVQGHYFPSNQGH